MTHWHIYSIIHGQQKANLIEASMHTILVWKYFPAACKLDKAELWMPHYYNWGALACSAVSRLLLCCFPLLPSLLHLSRYILRFHLLVLWSFKALLVIFTGTLRICDCETVWVFMTFMAFNSRGEMNCWIPPPSCLFVFFLFLSVFLPLSPPPPPRVSVQHPIVRDI